jgi:hypothetical protein
MSKLEDQLRAIRVFNTHELLLRFGVPGRDVGLTYYPPETRSVRPNMTKVYSPTFKTNPKAHWSDYFCKVFIGNRAESMPEAQAWASEQYGITEWAPDPTSRGGKVPKYVVDAAKAAVKKELDKPKT